MSVLSNPKILALTRGIIQLGAANGSEVSQINSTSINNQIYIEPVPVYYEELVYRTQPFLNKNIKCFNVAISDQTGFIDFFLGEAEHNSSIYDLKEDRPSFHQANRHRGKISVISYTLDDFFEKNQLRAKDYNLLYMDVQGAENLVIQGAKKSLQEIDFVYTEVSYYEIYKGTVIFPEFTKLMQENGFEYLTHFNICEGQGEATYIRRGIQL